MNRSQSYRDNSGSRRGGSYNGNRNSYGDDRNYNSSRVDSQLSSGRDYNRTSNSYKDRRNSGDKPKKPASMIEHEEPILPRAVSQCKQLMISLLDFSSTASVSSLATNCVDLASSLVLSGDIRHYSDEIADLFATGLSSLPQASVLATLLALIDRKETEKSVPALVIDKLSQKLLAAVCEGEVNKIKIITRSLACLSSCGSLSIGNSGESEGLCALLDELISVAYRGWRQSENEGEGEGGGNGEEVAMLSADGQIATFIVASTLPYALLALDKSTDGRATIDRATPLFARVLADYRSEFSAGGKLAVFHSEVVADELSSVAELSVGVAPGGGVVCWDSLWRASKVALDCITQVKDGVFVPSDAMLCLWTQISELQVNTAGLDEKETSFKHILPNFLLSGLEHRKQSNIDFFGGGDKSCGIETNTLNYLLPSFTIFDSSSSEQAKLVCQQLSSHEKALAMEYISDIIYFFDPIIRDDGTHIGTFETLCSHLIQLCNLFSHCQYFEYMLAEVLLTQLAHVSKHQTSNPRLIGLYRIILELCKKDSKFASVLALGTSILVQLGPEMDTTIWRGYAKWMSFHLLNTTLGWPYWNHWASELILDYPFGDVLPLLPSEDVSSDLTGQKETQEKMNDENEEGSLEMTLFLRLALNQCCQAVSRNEVLQLLPPAFRQCCESGRLFGQPNCYVLDESVSDYEGLRGVCIELKRKIENKIDSEQVEEWLEELKSPTDKGVKGSSTKYPQEYAVEAVVEGEAEKNYPEYWKLKILIHAIFANSKANDMSSLVETIDRYTDAIRVLTESDESKLEMLEMVFELYQPVGQSSGALQALDLLIRRGLVQVEQAATLLCTSNTLKFLHIEPHTYSMIETITDRSIDIFKACKQLCRQFDQKKNGSKANKEAALIENKKDDMDEDNHGDVLGKRNRDREEEKEDDEDDGERRGRRAARFETEENERRDPDMPESEQENNNFVESGDVDSPETESRQALENSKQHCREVLHRVVVSLISQMCLYQPVSKRDQEVSQEQLNSDIASHHLACVSLLARTLRLFSSEAVKQIGEGGRETAEEWIDIDWAKIRQDVAEISNSASETNEGSNEHSYLFKYAVKLVNSFTN